MIRVLTASIAILGLSCALLSQQQEAHKPLTNTDVVEMLHAGMTEKTVVLAIKANPANYDTSPQALIDLKNQGVSQKILDAMLAASGKQMAVRRTKGEPLTATSGGSCPVQILKVDPLANIFGTADRYGWELRVQYTNAGTKEIVAEKFGVIFYDATRDPRKPLREFTSTDRVKPGESKSPHWNDGAVVKKYTAKLGAQAWPEKLVFADGSTWQNDKSHQCSVKSW